MSMSRKHYVEIADAVINLRRGINMWDQPDQAIDQFVRELSDIMAADNPNFDRSRFKEACQ